MKIRDPIKNGHPTRHLSAFIDNELSPEQRASVGRHLDECPVCRKEFEALTSVNTLLKGLGEVSPSPGFSREFWKKVDAMESRRSRGALWLSGLLRAWRPALAAASAAAILAAGSVFFYRSGPENNDVANTGIADNMTFYSDYEIVRNLELFENWEAIASMEEI